MTFATATNILTIVLCIGVLVQSMRMSRHLKAMKSAGLSEMVAALDHSTTQARLIVAELRTLLRGEGASQLRSIEKGKEITDELNVIIGIADAAAERIIGAVTNVSAGEQATLIKQAEVNNGSSELEVMQ